MKKLFTSLVISALMLGCAGKYDNVLATKKQTNKNFAQIVGEKTHIVFSIDEKDIVLKDYFVDKLPQNEIKNINKKSLGCISIDKQNISTCKDTSLDIYKTRKLKTGYALIASTILSPLSLAIDILDFNPKLSGTKKTLTKKELDKDLINNVSKAINAMAVNEFESKNTLEDFEQYLNTTKLPTLEKSPLSNKYLELLRDKNDLDSYLKIFSITKKETDLRTAYNVASQNHGKNKVNPKTLDTFYETYVNSFDTFKNFSTFLDKLSNIDKKVYYKKFMKSKYFGKSLSLSNFLTSSEYKYILKNIKPKIDFYTLQDESIFKFDFNGETIRLEENADCKYISSYSENQNLGFIEGIFTFLSPIKDKTVYFSKYECKPYESAINKLENIEYAYNINNNLSSSLRSKTWTYTKNTGYNYNRYSRKDLNSYSSQTNSTAKSQVKKSSSSSSAYVVSIKKKGKDQIIKCSKGNDIRIYHDSYGKCTDNYEFGSYNCDYLYKKSIERCTRR